VGSPREISTTSSGGVGELDPWLVASGLITTVTLYLVFAWIFRDPLWPRQLWED